MMKKNYFLFICMISTFLWFFSCSNPALNNDQTNDSDNGSTIADLDTDSQKSINYADYPLGALLEDESMVRKVGFYYPDLSTRNALPVSVDLSSKMPPVGNQGLQNSCVGWATAYALKSFQEGREEKWGLSDPFHQFSPSWVYNQIYIGADKGAYVHDALNLIVNKGCDTINYFPYSDSNYTRQPGSESLERAAWYKAASWRKLKNNAEHLKATLAEGQAIVFRVDIYPDFINLRSGNEIYDNTSGKTEGGHAMCLVGYDDRRKAFKFINSWGTGWGLKGYGWISYDFVNIPSRVNFRAYYLKDKPNSVSFASNYSEPSGRIYQRYLKGDSGVNIISGDFNGDGKTDFIRQEKNGWDNDEVGTFQVYFSRGNGYFNVTTPSGGLYQFNLKGDYVNIIPGDFNGDGKTDFIRQEKGGWDDDEHGTFQVYFSRGNGYFNVATPSGEQYQSNLKGDYVNIIPGDFNGDGKTDFIRQEKNGWDNDEHGTFQVYFSRGNGYYNIVTPTGGQYQFNLKGSYVNIIPGDFNGDGKTDFIRQEKGGWDDDEVGTFQIYFSRGNGYFNVTTPSGYRYQYLLKNDNGVNIIPGDFNGDGKTDFIRQEKHGWDNDEDGTFQVYFSRGNGYFNIFTPSWRGRYQYLLKNDNGVNIISGDFNGDGKDDFLRQEKNGWDNDEVGTFCVYLTK